MSKDSDTVFAGYLMQKSINSLFKKWTKVYITIKNGIICVYSNKESKTANYLEDLAKYSIKITPIRNKPPYWVFQLLPIPEFSTSKLLKFGASSTDEMNLCLKIIQKSIDLSRKISNEENRKIDNSIKSISTLPRNLTNTNPTLNFPHADGIYDDLEHQQAIKNHQLKCLSLQVTSTMFQSTNNTSLTYPKLTEIKDTLPGTNYCETDAYDVNSKTKIKEIYNIDDLSNSNLNLNDYKNGLNIDLIDYEHHQESINSSPKLPIFNSKNTCMSYETENNDKNNSNILQINARYSSIVEDIKRISKNLTENQLVENSNQNENFSTSCTIELETEIEDKSIYDTSDSNNVDYSSKSCIISVNNSNGITYNQSNMENDNHNRNDNGESFREMNPSLNPQTDIQQDRSVYATYDQSNMENDNHNRNDNDESFGEMNPSLNPQTDIQQDQSVYATYDQSNMENDNHNRNDNDKSFREINTSLNPRANSQQDLSVYPTYDQNSNANINENINDRIDDLKHLENNSNQRKLLEMVSPNKILIEDSSLYVDYIENSSQQIHFKNVLFIGNSEEAFKALSDFYVLGSFLVRIDNGKQILTVQGDECIVKYILIYNSNNNTIGIKNQKIQFENLENLLLYYFNNNLPNRNFKLTVPYKVSGT